MNHFNYLYNIIKGANFHLIYENFQNQFLIILGVTRYNIYHKKFVA